MAGVHNDVRAEGKGTCMVVLSCFLIVIEVTLQAVKNNPSLLKVICAGKVKKLKPAIYLVKLYGCEL